MLRLVHRENDPSGVGEGGGLHGTGNLEVLLYPERDLERAQELFRMSYAVA
ncbi:hypothetical protein ACIPYQ_26435 [Streptomyces sp. NPDC090045]|uniref:hypothetical protein n=1 Tax=Streptomyces sp. NPDC090045 TaxID=3365927 RepID=UPI00381F28C2